MISGHGRVAIDGRNNRRILAAIETWAQKMASNQCRGWIEPSNTPGDSRRRIKVLFWRESPNMASKLGTWHRTLCLETRPDTDRFSSYPTGSVFAKRYYFSFSLEFNNVSSLLFAIPAKKNTPKYVEVPLYFMLDDVVACGFGR